MKSKLKLEVGKTGRVVAEVVTEAFKTDFFFAIFL